jgi:hypothetical protein
MENMRARRIMGAKIWLIACPILTKVEDEED